MLPSLKMALLAWQVARTAAVFNVDELVIVDDTPQRKDGTVGAGEASSTSVSCEVSIATLALDSCGAFATAPCVASHGPRTTKQLVFECPQPHGTPFASKPCLDPSSPPHPTSLELHPMPRPSPLPHAAADPGAAFLARVCQYLETPQYLRKALIPMHPDLRLAVSRQNQVACSAVRAPDCS